MQKFLSLWTLLLLLPTAVVHAQYDAFQQYTNHDGLPSTETYDVLQDSEGFIWIATDRGVVRFDGYRFKHFTSENGLPDNVIFELFEDHRNRIWFVSLSCQLSYYQNGAVHKYKYNDVIEKHIEVGIVSSFWVGVNDHVYLGFQEHPAMHIDSEGILQPLSEQSQSWGMHLQLNDTFQMVSLAIDTLTSEVKRRFKISSAKNYWDTTIAMPGSLANTRMSAFAKYRNNRVFCSFNDNLLEFHGGGIRKHALGANVIDVSIDKNDFLWVGMMNGGIKCFEVLDGKLRELHHLLDGQSVSGVLMDDENGLWFTTLDEGVFYLPALPLRNWLPQSRDSQESISALASNRNHKVVAGTSNGNFYLFEGGQLVLKESARRAGTPPVPVSKIFYLPFEDKFIISAVGVDTILSDGSLHRTRQRPEFKATAMVWLEGNSAWISTGMSVIRLGAGAINYSWDFHLRNYRFETIFATDTNSCWLGNPNGLYRLENDSLRNLKDIHPLFGNRVIKIMGYPGYRMLVATHGAGVLLWQEDGEILQIDKEKGLLSNIIQAIDVDASGKIWVGTNKGVSCIRLMKNKPEIQHVTSHHGLPNDHVEHLLVYHDTILAGTNRGLSVIPPGKSFTNEHAPPVYIRSFAVRGVDQALQAHYDLDYNEDFLQISYVGLAYKMKGKVDYRYRLSGFDEQWVTSTNTEIQYTALPPGDYKFEVMACNYDHVCSDSAAGFTFTIHAPYWTQWWFILAINLLAIALIIAVFYFRIRRVRAREEVKREIIRLKEMALNAQMNPHFIFNAMNSIQNFIMQNEKRQANQYLTKFASLMRLVLDNSSRISVPLELELQALTYYLELEKLRFDHRFDFEMEIDPQINKENTLVPNLLLQPFVENAIKHGFHGMKRQGLIKIQIQQKDEALKFILTDNGIGRKAAGLIPKSKNHESKGITLTKNRLELDARLDNRLAHFEIEDLYDIAGLALGTRVSFIIPLIREN